MKAGDVAIAAAVRGAAVPALAEFPYRRGSTGFRRIVLALFAGALSTFTVLYSVQALLPALADDFAVSPATASLTLSVSTAMLALGVIPLTALSERLGRIPVMTASLFAAGVFAVAAPFSPSLTVLLVLRALLGLALAGLQATAMSYLAEEVHPRSLGFAMGLYIAGNGIGGMLGRLLAGSLVDVVDWRVALGVTGALSLMCAVVFRAAILPSRGFTPRPAHFAGSMRSVVASFTDSGMLRLYAVGFLLMGGFVTVYNYLGFRLTGPDFGLSQGLVGLIFIVYLAGSAASSAAGRLTERFGRGRMLLLCAVGMLAGIGLMTAGNLAVVIAGLVVVTAGFFGSHAVASGWVGLRAKTLGTQGPAVYLLCYYLGSAAGGTAGGYALHAGGWGGVSWYTGAIAAGVILLAITLLRLSPARAAR
ncbi:MFS transporter [Tomitella cavernea]|uniref:MFS transporter n=1 Tax=Tomitella cavernea TaxID=1387982 RepID=UPI001903A437|nr:MFS transporter [Tomitella cavernea]